MNRLIRADLYRHFGNNNFLCLLKGQMIPGFKYMFIVRKINNSSKYSPMRYIFLIVKNILTKRYGFQIPTKTIIGPGFYIGHFGTIVINQNTIIGSNCNIAHNVTIGRTNRGNKKGTPIIGNNVWIGTGSVIVGKINIGNNVLIAPNSFVNTDIPDNSLVIGNPAKIIKKENATEGYINNIFTQ